MEEQKHARDDPPPPRPREVRPSPIRPGAEGVRQHNLTHCPYQSWCEVCVCVASKGKSDHYHREAPEPKDCDVARIQMNFMFVGARRNELFSPPETSLSSRQPRVSALHLRRLAGRTLCVFVFFRTEITRSSCNWACQCPNPNTETLSR